MSKLKTRITERDINTETGELINEKVQTYLADSETEFYITYCKVIGLMKDMGLGEVKTLAWIASHLQFNSNMVSISMGIKKKIAEDMDISIHSISNALVKLVKGNILYRDKNSGKRDATYYIHPEYFWKGDLYERKRTLKYVLEIEMNTKK